MEPTSQWASKWKSPLAAISKGTGSAREMKGLPSNTGDTHRQLPRASDGHKETARCFTLLFCCLLGSGFSPVAEVEASLKSRSVGVKCPTWPLHYLPSSRQYWIVVQEEQASLSKHSKRKIQLPLRFACDLVGVTRSLNPVLKRVNLHRGRHHAEFQSSQWHPRTRKHWDFCRYTKVSIISLDYHVKLFETWCSRPCKVCITILQSWKLTGLELVNNRKTKRSFHLYLFKADVHTLEIWSRSPRLASQFRDQWTKHLHLAKFERFQLNTLQGEPDPETH